MEKYQKIIANGREMKVLNLFGRRELINDAFREILVIETDAPLSEEDLNALRNDSEWDLIDNDGTAYTKNNYTEVVRYHYWVAQTDVNGAIIKEKNAIIEAKEAEVAMAIEALEQKEAEVEKVSAVIPMLLQGQTREKAMPLAEYIPDWAPGPFEEGDIRKDAGQIYQLIDGKAHDATNQPDWRPSQQPSLWFLWHGISRETAMPFVPVTGAHDMYRKGEWMILEDEYYEAIEDTAYSPKDYARAWKKEHGRKDKIWNIR